MRLQETLVTVALTTLLAAIVFFLLNLSLIALIVAIIGSMLFIAAKFQESMKE